MYGDMGIFSGTTMYILATCFGVALRFPAEVGVWGAPARPRSAPLGPRTAARRNRQASAVPPPRRARDNPRAPA